MNELKGYLNGLNTSQNFSHLREVSKIQQLQSLTLSPPQKKSSLLLLFVVFITPSILILLLIGERIHT